MFWKSPTAASAAQKNAASLVLPVKLQKYLKQKNK